VRPRLRGRVCVAAEVGASGGASRHDDEIVPHHRRHQIEDGHARTELFPHVGPRFAATGSAWFSIGCEMSACRTSPASKREDRLRDDGNVRVASELASALPCPVVNSPSPQASLAPHATLLSGWQRCARGATVLVTDYDETRRFADPALSRVAPGDRPAWRTSPSSGFIAAHWSPAAKFTMPKPELVRPCRHLAALCPAAATRRFCQTPERRWVCTGADPGRTWWKRRG
jgi:hypothetical protein